MRKIKKSLSVILAVLLMCLLLATTLTGCGPDTPPVPSEGPETGLYYYDANGTEYTIQLYSGNQFTLYNGVTKAGTYTVDESGAISFTFANEADGVANGTIANDVITFKYQNTETRFLRKINYSVSFETNGGTKIDTIYVVNGKCATHPADPEMTDHVFLGWYSDAECKTPFVFASTAITSDVKLYAKWAYKAPDATEYTVSFAGADVDPMPTIGGKLYGIPAPKKAGYTFGGWWISMSDNADKLTAKFTEDYTFTQDMTLYALWIPDGDNAPIVEVTEKGVSWNNVIGAIHYPVKITDPSGVVVYDDNVTGTSLNYSFTTAGEYKIEVSASLGGSTTGVTVRYFKAKALGSVYQFTVVEPSTLVFNKVPNAEEYIINIVCGNPAHDHSAYNNGNSTIYNFANCDMVEGGILFTVTAKAYGYADSVSRTFAYERKLDAVTDVTVENDIVSWSPVINASSYVIDVTVGGKTYSFTTAALDYDLKYIVSGDVSISIKAVAKGYLASEVTTYTYSKNTLATPTNVSAYGNKITWDAVAGNNVTYAVYINGVKYPTNTNELDLSKTTLTANAGDVIKVWVVSVSGSVESAASDSLSLNYKVFNGSLVYEKNTLYWPIVVGYDGEYEVRLNNDAAVTVSGVSTKLAFKQSGVNVVSVRFVGTGYTSPWISTEIDVYTISFDTRQGSGVDDIYFVPGDYVVLPTNTTRVGYTFNSWYNTSGSNGKLVTDGIVDNVGNIVLYAHWKSNTYKVIYTVDDEVGGVVNGATQDILFGEMYELAIPSSDSGSFIGWCTGPDGSGIQLTDDQGKSLAKWSLPEDTKVYPMFANNVLDFVERADGTWGVTSGPAIESVSNVIVPHTYQGKPVTAILENAFRYNTTMTSISIPNTVNVIGVGAFNTAYYLENIHIREIEGAVKPIFSSYNGMLIKNDLGTVYLEIVPRRQAGVDGTVVVPEGVDAIRNKAFQYNNIITKVVISSDVTSIADQAFFHCAKLAEIEFIGGGDKPLTISDGAFLDTDLITVVKFPARLASISNSTLNDLPKLAEIIVEDGGEHYAAIDGLLTNGDKNAILYAPVLWSGDVEIPVGVTTIAPGAFENRAGVTSVTIPAWVTTIGEKAFYNAINVASVTIEGGKFDDLTIGNYAFAGCKANVALTINGGSTMDDGALIIGAYAFAGNAKLATPVIAENANVTSIGAYAFNGCTTISEVIIQKTTTEIGEKAYAQCTNISKVGFAENGANVSFGSFVFEGCQKLSSISLPSTITTFDGSVFAGCNNISAIEVDEDNPALSAHDGVLFDKDATTILYYPRAKTVDMSTLPSTVTKIGNTTFQSNGSINTLVIPARITEIGDQAFESCANLTSVVFEGTDVVLGKSVFANCPVLTEVTLPSGMTAISEKAFYLTPIATIALPDTLNSIGAYAFAKTNLASIVIPGATAFVGEGAFSDCTKLATVTVNDGEVGFQLGTVDAAYGVFEGSVNITSAVLPKRITVIGARTFYNNSGKLTSVTLPEESKLTVIGDQAFYNCRKLSVVLPLPEGLTTIGAQAFYYVQGTNFKTITIPSTVTEIGASAFYYCSKLTTVTFATGGNVPLALSEKLFYGCSALTSVTFPKRLNVAYQTLTTAGGLELTNFYTMFTSCSKLKYIYVEDGCTKFSDINGIFCENDINGNPTRVIYCPLAHPNATVTIPHTITKVDNNAFNKCTKVTTIVFEDTPDWNGTPTLVLGDGYYSGYAAGDDSYPVFGGNYIVSIKLPIQLKSIGFGTFHSLKKSTGVTITFNMDSAPIDIVGQRAVYDSYVTSLALPRVASLAPYAIAKTTKLTSITFAPESTFEEIPANAFYDNKALLSFEVPASVKKIGPNAFTAAGTYSQNKLASITFAPGSQLQSIGDKAFANISLTSFTFPDTVTSIGTNIFQSCGALTEVILSNNMKNLYASDGTSIVAGVTKLARIGVSESNPYLAADDYGVLYSKDGKQLIFCPPALAIEGTYTMPDTVTSIEANALTYFGKYDTENPTNLTKLILSKNLVKIGEKALQNAYLGSIVIPASVQEIGSGAFAGMTTLTSVIFEDNSALTYIGASAFNGCSKLASINLPDSLAELGDGVFAGCKAITEIDLPASLLVLPDGTFTGCSALKTVNMKEGLERIVGDAFEGCSALESITFPASLRSITTSGSGVFSNCSSLTSVVFPENTKISNISAYTFVNCSKLTSFTLPASIAEISAGLIYNCPNIDTITINGNITRIPDGMFRGFANLKNINIPASVTEIGDYAFEGCANLETITLPTALTKIGKSAFRGCTALNAIVIGDNVTYIGDYAFENCTSLESVVFTSGNAIENLGSNPEVESAIFRNTTALKSIDLPNSVKIIGARLFENSAIETIHIPASLTAISEYAFLGCKNLKALSIPDSVKTIYSYAFESCTNLTDVVIGYGTESFGTAIFMNCTSLKSVNIPATVNSMAGNPFINCPALTNIDFDMTNADYIFVNNMILDADMFTLVYYSPIIPDETPTLPETVRAFASGAFYGSQIKSFEIPSTLTEISDIMFMDCKNLATITLPRNITRIGDRAFMGCSALTAIEIPMTVTDIGAYAFAECSALVDVNFVERNSAYTIGAHAFDGATSLSEIDLPLGLTGLAPYMFANTGFVTYTIPSFITSVNVEGVFANNTKLESVTMHNAVGRTLGIKFFMNCTALKSFTFPNCIELLGPVEVFAKDINMDGVIDPMREVTGYDTKSPSYAFAGCTALESINLNKVAWIGAYAFEGCTNLSSVTFGATIGIIGDYAFANCSSLTTVDLSSKSLKLWDDNGKYFTVYIEIGRYAFYNCSSLTSVTFKSGLRWGTLYDGAFEGCTSLMSLTWPSQKNNQKTEGDPFRGWTEEQKHTP